MVQLCDDPRDDINKYEVYSISTHIQNGKQYRTESEGDRVIKSGKHEVI